jgi:hypothetical protein
MGFKDGGGKGDDAAEIAERAIDKAAGGRRDGGKEENPDEAKLKKEIPGLAKALKEKNSAVEAYNKKRKAVAKNCGFMSNVVDRAAKEYLSEPEDRELAIRYAEQLDLALDVVAKLKK